MDVNFSGNVSAQEAPGETVTVIVTLPDGTADAQTATTNADGSFATSAKEYLVGGSYSFAASIPADGKYKSASAQGTFSIVVLADRTLTINVNLV